MMSNSKLLNMILDTKMAAELKVQKSTFT